MTAQKAEKGFFTPKNTMLLAAVAIAALACGFLISCYIPYSLQHEKKTIMINYGTGLKKIARLLDENKIIKNSNAFIVYTLATGAYRKLQAGEYEFSGTDSIASVTAKMARGEVISHEVTITEGSDLNDIAATLQERGIADAQKFLTLCKDSKFLALLGIHYASAEGLLFPDTYKFLKGEGEGRIIRIMHEKFIQKSGIDTAKSYIIGGKAYKGYSVLKMASIIEKEAQAESERALVSSVFYNRLKAAEAYQRRLESCATVRYALNKKQGAITFKDIQVDSAYNTYKIIGLPPTPICNPGAKAIAAAISPAKTNYLYFVVKGDGTHIFSATFEEHKKAKKTHKLNGGY